jgi:hypothetical protein
MKNMMKVMAGIALLVALGAGSSQAQVAYTDAALQGCYGFRSDSVGVAPPLNTSTVGTICFNGAGVIIPNAGALDQTGWMQTTNGVAAASVHVGGKYGVTNVPGQGMGSLVFTNGCEYYFSINSVDANGIAHGFQFSLVNYASCEIKPGDPNTVGGTAYLQPAAQE